MRLLVRMTEIPWIDSTERLFKVHDISIGKSPLLTVHVREDMSSELTGSSVKSNGIIWGGTTTKIVSCKYRLRVKSQNKSLFRRDFSLNMYIRLSGRLGLNLC